MQMDWGSYETDDPLDRIAEVIVTVDPDECIVYHPKTADRLLNWKPRNIIPKTLCVLNSTFFLTAVPQKPLLKLWYPQKMQQGNTSTFYLPGVVGALAVSSCGDYCFAGINNKIYTWEVSTGALLSIISKHYQDITCLQLNSDEAFLLSGAKDGHVCVWFFSDFIDINYQQRTVTPRFIWTHHSTEIKDICCSRFGTRVITISMDTSCKVYEIDSGILLTTIILHCTFTAGVMDNLEYLIFLSNVNGDIYRINTYERMPKEITLQDLTQDAGNITPVFHAHEGNIVSLAMSFEGTMLLSASIDRTIKGWNPVSMALMLKIPHDGRISNAFFISKPHVLHNKTDAFTPMFQVCAFQRNITGDNGKVSHIKTRVLPLKLMQDEEPDKYSPRDEIKLTAAEQEEMDDDCEDMFEEKPRSETMKELKTINQQIYSYTVGKIFDNQNNQQQQPPIF